MKILMVITSHDQLGNIGRKTGFWEGNPIRCTLYEDSSNNKRKLTHETEHQIICIDLRYNLGIGVVLSYVVVHCF